MFSSLIAWLAIKQHTTALSSTEAKYMALSHALKEALWLCLLLLILKMLIPQLFPLLCDNQSTLNIVNSLSITSRSKHIDVWYHFIHEHLLSGSFMTTWIPTGDIMADIFTKPLSLTLHAKHIPSLGLVHLP